MSSPIHNQQALVELAASSLEHSLHILQKHAGTAVKVQCSGQLTLTIADTNTKTYTISFTNDREKEGAPVKAQVSPETSAPTRKRLNDKALQSNTKRIKSNGKVAQSCLPTTNTKPSTDGEFTNTPPNQQNIRFKLDSLSEQISWLEQCRRLSQEHHTTREENWKSSRISFHYNNQRAREAHEQWLVQEMAWQRNTLAAIARQTAANSPVQQSLKWETPDSTVTNSSHPHLMIPTAPMKKTRNKAPAQNEIET